ncbi:hypothetical protein SAMN06295937_1003112 [Sphingopyxis flava]|uniref:Uncharacterized protein n=1 Tax=Sphingopyxis flava TaxID=1507287 RepID=A0A1T5ACW0_9SPHN|nr:hypothetical protein SAMN06295937_1003112 [Sphingopyxis flava]
MFGWFRRSRPPTPALSLDQLVARGRALNADFARRRSAALSPERRRHIRRLIDEGFIRPRGGTEE